MNSRELHQMALNAMQAMQRIHTEPAGYEGKHGKEFTKFLDLQLAKVNAALALQEAAISALQEALAAPEQEPVGWKVVTWNSKTTKSFLTRPEAIDYLTMNDADGDWHIEPIFEATLVQPLSDEELGKIWDDALDHFDQRDQLRFIARAIENAVRSKT